MTVRARQPGIATGLPLGRMHPDTRPSAPPNKPGRTCARSGCDAILSRYNDGTKCAACVTLERGENEQTTPLFPRTDAELAAAEAEIDRLLGLAPKLSSAERARAIATQRPRLTREEKAANRNYKLCTCGRDYHKRQSARCSQCEADRRRTPGSKGSKFCAACGKQKGSNNGPLCRDCRYPSSEDAHLRRLREDAA